MELKQADFSRDSDKEQSRAYNLAQVRRCSGLCDRHGHLLCDWAEMPGLHAPTLRLLLQEKMLGGPGRFLGIESDPAVFDNLCEEFGEHSPTHEFFNVEAEVWARGGRASGVGVLNWDTYHLSRGDCFQDRLAALWTFALRQERKVGAFALIINAGLDRGASVEDFKSALLELGHRVSDEHLQLPGVLYGESRADRNSRRINYAVLFGPTKGRR